MKVLRSIALFLCFVLVATLAGYFMIRFLEDSGESVSERGKGNSTRSSVTATATPTPLISGSVILKKTDEVNIGLLEDTTISNLVDYALASVVQINAEVTRTDAWGRIQQGTSMGSGIILDTDETTLYIATNHHVIDGASEITVTFPDGTDVTAELRGSDAAGDLAILMISSEAMKNVDASSYRIATLADSTQVEVGEMVIALGNALGYGTSVTVGFVSAVDRIVQTEEGELLLIQTDAAINPGNSGGALINTKGEVIGINSLKYSENYSKIEGMGFAIPITQAIPILNELKQLESFPEEEAGYLGVYIATVTTNISESFGWPRGVYVSSVAEGGAAAEAGILPGDIILSVNGIRVLDTTQLITRVTSYQAGTEITLVVSRDDGTERKEISIPVTLTVKSEIQE